MSWYALLNSHFVSLMRAKLLRTEGSFGSSFKRVSYIFSASETSPISFREYATLKEVKTGTFLVSNHPFPNISTIFQNSFSSNNPSIMASAKSSAVWWSSSSTSRLIVFRMSLNSCFFICGTISGNGVWIGGIFGVDCMEETSNRKERHMAQHELALDGD